MGRDNDDIKNNVNIKTSTLSQRKGRVPPTIHHVGGGQPAKRGQPAGEGVSQQGGGVFHDNEDADVTPKG